jgi:hypothetical protein
MRRSLGLAAVIAGFLAGFPGTVKAQKNAVVDTATDQDYKTLQSVKDLTGRLAEINSGAITFRLDIPHMVPNPKFRPPKGNNNLYNQMNNLYRQQIQAMATPNLIQRQIKMQQVFINMQRLQMQMMQQAAAASNNPNSQPFMVAHQYKDFDLEMSDKVSLRKMFLETEYDDKGEIKTYTEKEKADLRGKDPSPSNSYTAKMEELQPGQSVQIYLRMPKKTKPASDSDKADEKAKDKDADKDKAKDAAGDAKADKVDKGAKNADAAAVKTEIVHPIVTKIVVLQPSDGQLTDIAPAKKKKANQNNN